MIRAGITVLGLHASTRDVNIGAQSRLLKTQPPSHARYVKVASSTGRQRTARKRETWEAPDYPPEPTGTGAFRVPPPGGNPPRPKWPRMPGGLTRAGLAVAAFALGVFFWNVENSTLPYDVVPASTAGSTDWIVGKGRASGKVALQVVQDKEGDVWLFDPVTETLYMDTGDATVGMLAVTREGQMYNFFVDPDTGKVAEKKLGTVDDLITLDTENMGTITGFPAVTGPLPPNIPLSVDPRTGEQEYPPILEDRELLLVPKGGPSLFGKKEGPLEGLRSDGVATEKEMRRLQKEIDRLEMRGAGVQLP